MTITLDGSSLTIEKIVAIARHNEKVELAPEALERIKVCRLMLEEKLANKEVMYGTNTGIGEFSETMLNDEQVKEFQKYLIYNHAAGIGEPAPIEYVRAALAGRANVHAHGNSGCRPEITLTLVEMLNKGVTPVVCQKGSVGASGDLAPLAHLALALIGEGTLVGGPRFAAGDIGGEVRIFVQYTRSVQPAQHRHHQQITGAECTVEPLGIAEAPGKFAEPSTDALVEHRQALAMPALVTLQDGRHRALHDRRRSQNRAPLSARPEPLHLDRRVSARPARPPWHRSRRRRTPRHSP